MLSYRERANGVSICMTQIKNENSHLLKQNSIKVRFLLYLPVNVDCDFLSQAQKELSLEATCPWWRQAVKVKFFSSP